MAPVQSDPALVRQFLVAEEDDGIRLDRWFRRHLPEAPFTLVSRWARTGQLRLDGKRAAPGDRILAGQAIRVPPADTEAPRGRSAPARPALGADEIAFVEAMVLHRDKDAILIDKPPGLAVQGGTGTKVHLDGLLDGLADEKGQRPKLVHRLDKDTSGILLLARSARAAAFFSKSFAGRTARKTYWALVVGLPEVREGQIDLAIAKQPGSGGEKMHPDPEGLAARTRYRVIDRAGNAAAWLELQPLTGRTHQLRVHMAAIGHPIVGDGKYGGQAAFLTGAISRKLHLHARALRIDHPAGGCIEGAAPPPPHFAQSLAALGFDPELAEAPPKAAPARDPKARPRSALSSRRGERRSRGAPARAARKR